MKLILCLVALIVMASIHSASANTDECDACVTDYATCGTACTCASSLVNCVTSKCPTSFSGLYFASLCPTLKLSCPDVTCDAAIDECTNCVSTYTAELVSKNLCDALSNLFSCLSTHDCTEDQGYSCEGHEAACGITCADPTDPCELCGTKYAECVLKSTGTQEGTCACLDKYFTCNKDSSCAVDGYNQACLLSKETCSNLSCEGEIAADTCTQCGIDYAKCANDSLRKNGVQSMCSCISTYSSCLNSGSCGVAISHTSQCQTYANICNDVTGCDISTKVPFAEGVNALLNERPEDVQQSIIDHVPELDVMEITNNIVRNGLTVFDISVQFIGEQELEALLTKIRNAFIEYFGVPASHVGLVAGSKRGTATYEVSVGPNAYSNSINGASSPANVLIPSSLFVALVVALIAAM